MTSRCRSGSWLEQQRCSFGQSREQKEIGQEVLVVVASLFWGDTIQPTATSGLTYSGHLLPVQGLQDS